MTPRAASLSILSIGLAAGLAVPASADQAPRANMTVMAATAAGGALSEFVPRPSRTTTFDYKVWDEALEDMVLDLGPSLRRRASRPQAQVGTRVVRGHTSPLRMEGSRFTFAYVDDDFEEGLSEYRKDLEELGTRHDIATFPRDEQLAYWLNLHNVALIEKIAAEYPVRRPSQIKVEVDGQERVLDEAKFITVKGVPLSLKDIRTRIVYPNWNDRPEVIYGFFRGDIGGPRLAETAFTGNAVTYMTSDNAEEFINSLRGFDLASKARRVSRIYEEAAPFYFPDLERDLLAHMRKWARAEVVADLNTPRPVEYLDYDIDIADLAGGTGRGSSGLQTRSTNTRSTPGVSYEVARTLRETGEKYKILLREGLIGTATGEVIIEDIETEDLTPDPRYAPLADTPEE